MNKLLLNGMELIGEFTGLRQRNWEAAQVAHYADIKDGIVRASGLVALMALQRGDYETAQLERKIFLHELAETDPVRGAINSTQRAAQEVLDEVYAQNASA